MRFPANLRYSKDHTWVRIENGLATIGITEFAQYELGNVSSVKVFNSGELLLKGEVFATIEAVAMQLNLRLPMSGNIVEVNWLLQSHPEMINSDPYGDGWIIRLKPAHEDEINELMQAHEYMSGW